MKFRDSTLVCIMIFGAGLLVVSINGFFGNSIGSTTTPLVAESSTQELKVIPAPEVKVAPAPTPKPGRTEIRRRERAARRQAAREREGQRESEREEARTHRESGVKDSWEYKLATIDNGYVDTDDRSVKRFRSLLDQLTSKYAEGEKEVSDMTVKARELMNNNGISESCETVMEDMNRALPNQILSDSGTNNQKYAEYVALYVTQRNSGSSRAEVVEAIRALTTL